MKASDLKQEATLTYLEKCVLWAREERHTLTMDTDLDRNGDRMWFAMLRPWKQDPKRPIMFWAHSGTLEDAVNQVILKSTDVKNVLDLDFGYRPWKENGSYDGSTRRAVPTR